VRLSPLNVDSSRDVLRPLVVLFLCLVLNRNSKLFRPKMREPRGIILSALVELLAVMALAGLSLDSYTTMSPSLTCASVHTDTFGT